MSHPKIPDWSPRIKPEKIRRLYESDARGMLDEDLLDEVGYGLYSRCKDILEVSEAVRGRVRCPGCGQIIFRKEVGKAAEKGEILACGKCAWQIAWEDYLKAYQGQRLFAGQADSIFASFIAQWEATSSPQAKMIAIDYLIHEFHLYLQQPGRPIAVNVIQGKVKEAIQLINDLAYGPGSTPGLQEQKEAWYRKLEANLCYPAGTKLSWRQPGSLTFGKEEPGIEYISRPGAYAVIFDNRRRVAVMKTAQGFFLPGGGSEPGEIPEDTLRREIGEECGREAIIHRKIGEVVEYLFARNEGNYYRIEAAFFTCAFGKKTGMPTEKVEFLTWLDAAEAYERLRPAQSWAVQQAGGR